MFCLGSIRLYPNPGQPFTKQRRPFSRIQVFHRQALLLGVGSLLGSAVSLGRLLLGLALLLSGISGQRLLEDLENLLVGDLLVRLELAEVKLRGGAQLGDAVLGDGCRAVVLAQLR
jgi:hypothetical protein